MLVPGKYRASAMSAKIVENSKTGSISFVTTVRLDDVEGTPEMDNWTCLVQTDGTPSQISYDSLRKAFPFWDGMDPIALADTVTANPGAYQVEAALDYDTFNGKQVLKAKYINPVGGGRGMDDKARASFVARYSSTWRAWAGTSAAAAKPATPTAPIQPQTTAPAPPITFKPLPPKPTPPMAPPVQPPPKQGAISSEEACWQAYTKENSGLQEAELNAKWWETLTKLVGKTDGLTPEDWGKVLAAVTDNIPY